MQYEKGVVFSLRELGERFIKFATTSNATTQAWEQLDDRINTFYGATLRVPLNIKDDVENPEDYYIIGDDSLTKPSGTQLVGIAEYIELSYNTSGSNITVDTTKLSLNDVYNYLTQLPVHEHGRFIFNGVENDLVAGQTISQIIYNCNRIINRSKELGLTPTLVITPNSAVFSSASLIEQYNLILGHGFFNAKPTIVCIGDSLTDPNSLNPPFSWTDVMQSDFSELFVINKGIGGDTTIGVLNRFQQDVLDLSPDMCLFLIGLNDFGLSSVTDIVARLETMVDSCLSNNIVPIIGLYSSTFPWIRDYTTAFMGAPASISDTLAMLNKCHEYYEKCKDLALSKGINFVDVTDTVRDGFGTVVGGSLQSDGVHFSVAGATIVGHSMAKKLKYIVTSDNIVTHSIVNNVLNIYDIFCEYLGVAELSASDIAGLVSADGKSYNANGLSWITNVISTENTFAHVSGVSFYISFQHNRIDGNTYQNWLTSNDKYMSESAVTENYFDSIIGATSKYGTGSPFKNSGYILAVGVHTLYDDNLWMCEQGGITCADEALNQKDNDNLMGAIQYIYPKPYNGTFSTKVVHFIPFPSRGCPWFAYSDSDVSKYQISKLGIKYWFTKNDYNATITYCTSELAGEPVFQTMSFGKLEGINDSSYNFPLYVAGGTEALTNDIFIYTPSTGSNPTYISGNVYDLSLKTIGLSSCSILRPCKFNGANSSNFRILSPEGIWRNLYGYSQGVKIQRYFSCGIIYNWMSLLQPPTIIGSSYHSALPFMSDSSYLVDYKFKTRTWDEKDSYFLGRVITSFYMSLDHNEDGIQGYIPNLYYTGRHMIVGEVEINNKKFLSVPNNFETKKEYYEAKVGVVNTGWTSDELLAHYENNNIIHDRILIPLEK